MIRGAGSGAFSFPPLPTVRDLIKLYGLSAKQQLSQNFILDLNLCEKFARQADPLEDCVVLEVGPGPGGITRGILKAGARKTIVVEKDPRFLPALNLLKDQMKLSTKEDKLDIILGDVLEVNEREIIKPYIDETTVNKSDPPIRVIGNLPFGVATELLLKWIRQAARKDGIFTYGNILFALSFQTEVADRIIAVPNTKEYSRLSIMSQQFLIPELGFRIDSKSFVPPPDVQATVVRFRLRDPPLVPEVCVDTLEILLRAVFGQRRKKLSNCMKLIPRLNNFEIQDLIDRSQIDVNLRPENLTVQQWCHLAINYKKLLDAKPS